MADEGDRVMPTAGARGTYYTRGFLQPGSVPKPCVSDGSAWRDEETGQIIRWDEGQQRYVLHL